MWDSHKQALLNRQWHSIRRAKNKVDGPECCTARALWAVCCCGLERYKISVFSPLSAALWPRCQCRSVSLMSRRHSASQHAVRDVGGGVSVCVCVCVCVRVFIQLEDSHADNQLLHPVTSFSSRIVHSFSKNNEMNILVYSRSLITVYRCCIVACSLLCVCVFCFVCLWIFTYFRFILHMRSRFNRHTNGSRTSTSRTCAYFLLGQAITVTEDWESLKK